VGGHTEQPPDLQMLVIPSYSWLEQQFQEAQQRYQRWREEVGVAVAEETEAEVKLSESSILFDVSLFSDPAHPELEAANARMVREYAALRQELHDNLDALAPTRGQTAGAFAGVGFDQWRQALRDAAEHRYMLANNVAAHYREVLQDDHQQLKKAETEVRELKGKLDYVSAGHTQIAAVKAAAESLDYLLNYVEASEAVLAGHPLEGAVKAVETVGEIAAKKAVIDKFIDVMSEYAEELDLRTVGFENMEDLKEAVNHAVEQLADRATRVESHESLAGRAEALRDQPLPKAHSTSGGHP
jgi:hypothetical protein